MKKPKITKTKAKRKFPFLFLLQIISPQDMALKKSHGPVSYSTKNNRKKTEISSASPPLLALYYSQLRSKQVKREEKKGAL